RAPRRQGRQREEAAGSLRAVPDPARAPRAGGRLALGRPAADGGHRPRAHEPAAGAAAGRTLAGPGAAGGQAGVRGDPAHQPRRHDRAAGGTERLCGAEDRAPRLRARARPHRAGRRPRHPARQRIRAQGLHRGLIPFFLETQATMEFRSRLHCTVAALALAAAPAFARDGVKIGYSGPLSGGAALYGKNVLDGMQMAASEINAAGFEVAGKKYKLEIVSLDDKYNPSETAINAQRLVQEHRTPAILVP